MEYRMGCAAPLYILAITLQKVIYARSRIAPIQVRLN